MDFWLVTTEYPPFFGGGIATYCIHTAQMLAEAGHAVTIIVGDSSLQSRERVEMNGPVRVVRFKAGNSDPTLLFVFGYMIVDGVNKARKNSPVSSKAVVPSPSPSEPVAPKRPELSFEKELQWELNVIAIRKLRASMKNPSSFTREEALQMDDSTLMPQLSRYKLFQRDRGRGQAVITGHATCTSDDRERFALRWNSRCANKAGIVITHIRHAL